ncbi:GSCOCG00002930001-RA-CDS, partial [Cotesia congregata]
TAAAASVVVSAVLASRLEVLRSLDRLPVHPYGATVNHFNLPRSQGATDSFSLALLSIVSGRGNECRTIAPYRPYSAIM